MSAPPLYQSYDPVTQRSSEITEDEDGLCFIHSQNTRPIVESAKRIAASADPSAAWRNNGLVHVARIPMVIWQQLQKLGITKDEAALNKWLDERDNRVFRTDDGRKL